MDLPSESGIATKPKEPEYTARGQIQWGNDDGSKCGACSEAPEDVLEEIGERVAGTARFRRRGGMGVHDVDGLGCLGVMCRRFGLGVGDRPMMRHVRLRRPGMMGVAQGSNGRADPGGGIEETRDAE